MMNKAALVIDLEFWHTSEFLREYVPRDYNDMVLDATIPILNLLDKNKTKATFAIVGQLAEKYPDLVRTIYNKGHEVASHCYSHRMLNDLGVNKFEDEIKRSVEILSAITGEQPIGFRAPSFSVTQPTSWVFKILKKYNFKYDASIFPIKTILYGVSNAPLIPYKPNPDNILLNEVNADIIEFPATVMNFVGKLMPISGGFYFRIFPLWFIKYALRRVILQRPIIFYIHPWDLYVDVPRINLHFLPKIITYYGLKYAMKKFELLLNEFNFRPIKEVLFLSD
ncbi:polysaccharide deacetylase family protein [Desulfotomaculum copahuensis]|uniref:polysaccharide deacetylase family protein n=1 Tax=Desulfotomaculum copahuensis TaxID=1838280 RepID=UPI00098F0982|nr:polysaccharide deacetylase family protein [Desulfotomaculum copahuensis]